MDWYSTVLLDQSEHCIQHASHTTRKSFLTFPLFDMQAGIKPPTFCFDDLLHVECTPHGLTVSLLALLAPAAGDGGVSASVRCTEDVTADHFSQNETQTQVKRTPWKVTDSVMNSVSRKDVHTEGSQL